MSVRVFPAGAGGGAELTAAERDHMAEVEFHVAAELEETIQKALQSFDTNVEKAAYKLEMLFRGGPSRNGNVRGGVAVWSNGDQLHEGGDSFVYLCPKKSGDTHCLAPIPDANLGTKVAVCPRCAQPSKPADLVGVIVWDMPREVRALVHLFHSLGCNADLRMGIIRESVIAAAEGETTRERGGDLYRKVQSTQEWITYPLANIIRDTAVGTSLERRFEAFLKA
jgi:hypothetical protein